MAKDGSRRSSIAASTRPQSPHENNNDASAQEPQQTGEAAPSHGHSSSAKLDPTPSAANGTHSQAAESQPMTATKPNPSNPSAKEAASSGAGPALTYGTRSRNRTGVSRPNYAEDKELDIDLELASAVKEGNGRKSRAVDSVPTTGNGPTPSKSTSGPGIENALPVQSNHKESIPGTSSFSANPTAAGTHSKKRKATAQAATQPQTQAPAQNAQLAMSRKANMAAYAGCVVEDSNMLSFEGCGGHLKDNKLVADDGTILEVNDHAYLVCEPPGEPYYLGRIMEFLHANNDATQPIDALRLNWYYRAKDIGRKVYDTRQVFASMHSDVSPLTALRGKCQIKHKSEVAKLDELRKTKDCFWYEKLYDRYIHRYYDVVPTSQVINVPAEVKKVLDERWKFIVVEPTRGKELTSAVKSCKRCSKYCASSDSVDCAVCRNTYHMSCVNPPLLKKPSRGFAWACGPCSKAQEKKLEARNTPNVNDPEEEENNEEDEEGREIIGDELETGRTSSNSGEVDESFHPGTAEQIHQASQWLFRYLGQHCNVEDALDYDDRIYPRASSRLGPRHQAVVPAWPGRPVEYVKPIEVKRKYTKGGGSKKDTKASKDALAALEADKIARENRPKWIMDEPVGYIHRGEDYEPGDPNSTAELLYKLPDTIEIPGRAVDSSNSEELPHPSREQIIFGYMGHAAMLAKPLGLPDLSTNMLDVALHTLHLNRYNVEKALHVLSQTDKRAFKEPDLTALELRKFEDGVSKFGSEWHSLKKYVKTVSAANIVRFYYTWKKTPRGREVWGNYKGRKGKKEAKRAATAGKLQDDVADENDDSAFDNEKAYAKKRLFQCKFCSTRESRQWRRAPNTPAGTMISDNPGAKPSAKDKGNQFMVALCRRCAELWRRYGIEWEDIDEVKKAAQTGSKAWKRKMDEEILKELVAANEVTNQAISAPPVAPVSSNAANIPVPTNQPNGTEPPRKKLKGSSDRDLLDASMEATVISAPKKKAVPEKPVAPPPPPEPPKAKLLPCAICGQMDPLGDQHLSCKECRMTVHRNCYGVVGENRSPSKWVCDMCSNDKNPQVSIQYKCTLCPIEYTEHDFVEPPKPSHKKKTEKDRERDRLERESAQKVADYFRKKQEELNKPVNPREPLKRTANNNWVHVTCAVFTPEVKFGNAKALEPSEGIPSIPTARYDEVCKVCKRSKGACVSCHCCKSSVHVECAHQAGYVLGFDITPVKGSRRDQFTIVNVKGEVGTMTAGVWCKEHVPVKSIIHRMEDIVDAETGLNALQLYVKTFKQADLTLTGTVRKATLVNQSTKVLNPQMPVAQPPNRRTSTTTGAGGRGSISHAKTEDVPRDSLSSVATASSRKLCVTCEIDVSPKWWPFPSETGEASAPAEMFLDADGNQAQVNDLPLTNGHAANSSAEMTGGTNVALAAAALHRNPVKSLAVSTEFQCHRCHWDKVRKRSPTPPPPPPPPSHPPRESSRPPFGMTESARISTPEPEPAQPAPASFSWPPPPPSFPANGSSYNWPRQSPGPQAASPVNHLNGNRSPLGNPGHMHPHAEQSQLRHPAPGLPHSPRQNGHPPHGPNGYHPPSPHHKMGSSAVHMQNGHHAPYASTRPAPQHLTNGGPPPRAPEHPFSHHHAPIHPHYGQPHAIPPAHFDPHSQGRDVLNQQHNNSRPNDGRVNGGASASPSLRNLLS
ncbi:BAH domain-containing protein [Diplocarpon rosae]|nr:BAH domain-containing protein [Diplocarpon rosae]